MLILAHGLLVLAGASLLTPTLALIGVLFPDPQKRGAAIGIWAMCFTLGGVIGPLVGGIMIEVFWWGSVFLAGLPVMVLLLILGSIYLPEYKEPDPQQFDFISPGLLLTSILTLTYAMKSVAQDGPSLIVAATVVAGLLIGVGFVRRQRTLTNPMIDLSLFLRAAFVGALGANAIALFSWVGASLLVAQYLQLVHGLSPFIAGLWTVPPPAIASVIGCLAAPPAAQRIRPAVLIACALVLVSLSLAAIAILGTNVGFIAVIAGMVGLGLGVAIIVTLGTDVVLAEAPDSKAGAAAAMSETGTELGGALGVAILGSAAVAQYRAAIVLPNDIGTDLVVEVRDTLGAAAEAATRPGEERPELLLSAQEAFVHGLQVASGICAVLVLVIAALFAIAVLRKPELKEEVEV